FAQKAIADADASPAGELSPGDQDREVFKIAGQLLFGPDTYTIGNAGHDLDKLSLVNKRRKGWSTFFSAMEEADRSSPGSIIIPIPYFIPSQPYPIRP
ncbi:hypothetical protein CF319_g9613, partial [Tilletia indica]